MRKLFPRYTRGSLQKIEEKFKQKDKEMISKYLTFCAGTGGTTTVNKYHAVLVKIVDVFGGDMEKIDLDRLRQFLQLLNNADLLPPTKNEIKKVLKRFLKEFYDDWSERFKQLKDIKGEDEINQNKINGDTILRPTEIKELMMRCNSLMYKALIMTFYESAARPEELLKVQWKDINLEDGSVKLKSSKTGNIRINPLQNSILYLKQYKQQYPFPDVTVDDYVFVNYQKRGTHISRVAAGLYIKRLGKNVLKRDIFMYLIRHTRATELQKVLTAKIYEKFMDHSIETATRYSHLDKSDVRDAMFSKVYKIEDIPEERKHELELKVEKLTEGMKEMNQFIKKMMKAVKGKDFDPLPIIKETSEKMEKLEN